jgi:hypothetical protein
MHRIVRILENNLSGSRNSDLYVAKQSKKKVFLLKEIYLVKTTRKKLKPSAFNIRRLQSGQ